MGKLAHYENLLTEFDFLSASGVSTVVVLSLVGTEPLVLRLFLLLYIVDSS